jgi:N6-adenosine-specific RNA methylase IME4
MTDQDQGTQLATVAPEERKPINAVALVEEARFVLSTATNPAEILQIEAKLTAVEQLMRETGLYPLDEIRPINEMRMRARWMLGKLIAAMKSRQGQRTDLTADLTSSAELTKSQTLEKLELDRQTASEAQRIGALPEEKFQEVIEQWRPRDDLLHFADLLQISKPYWKLEKRKETHRHIAERATAAKIEAPEKFGPFALIYADPPWVYETYSPETATRLPDDHYPTRTDQEIIDYKVHDRWTIPEISAKDCALFMWCTSSNLERALRVMEKLGFEFKTSAVWDKMIFATGLIFRNQHEVLLYGTRGSPPKPLYLPISVFRHKRGGHSAKPREVRAAPERMYPSYDADSRIEMFCRGVFDGWTCVGLEAHADYIDDDDNEDAIDELAETSPEVRMEVERRIVAGELITIETARKLKAVLAETMEYAGTIDRLRKEKRDLIAFVEELRLSNKQALAREIELERKIEQEKSKRKKGRARSSKKIAGGAAT